MIEACLDTLIVLKLSKIHFVSGVIPKLSLFGALLWKLLKQKVRSQIDNSSTLGNAETS